MVTRAQLSQERSRQRREELLAAAIELFAEGGARSVTHRAVARRAGLPPATTTYYFASIDELLSEALREHMAQWRSDLDTLAGLDTSGPAIDIENLSDTIAAVFAVRGPETAALELAIYLAATKSPELRDEATEALRALERLVAGWLVRLGIPGADLLAPAMIAVFAGVALRRQSDLADEPGEAAIMSQSMKAIVAAHLLGTEKVDALLAETTSAPVD